MIINLINTILIACGMAVNTTNFNSKQKPYRRNAVNEIDISIPYEQAGTTVTYDYTDSPAREVQSQKYFLNSNLSQNYTNDYMLIQNTTYSYRERYNDGTTARSFSMSYYQITNYYDSAVEFVMSEQTSINTAYTTYWETRVYVMESVENMLNLTLNISSYTSNLNFLQSNVSKMTVINNGTLANQGTTTNGLNESTQTILLDRKQTIGLMFYFRYTTLTNMDSIGQISPDRFIITGSVNQPTASGEIINVPGLMLTVLTLPFSFISQAFNLTIFPNTPYAINFSNLFRTIIAIFVLLWLIKKIFK